VIAVHGEGRPLLLLAVGPDYRKPVDGVGGPQAEHHPAIARRSIAAAAANKARLLAAGRLEEHARAHQVGVVLVRQFHSEPVVARRRDVAQDGDRLIDVADDDIGLAVVVEIAQRCTAGKMRLGEVGPPPLGDLREFAAPVPQQDWALAARPFAINRSSQP